MRRNKQTLARHGRSMDDATSDGFGQELLYAALPHAPYTASPSFDRNWPTVHATIAELATFSFSTFARTNQ